MCYILNSVNAKFFGHRNAGEKSSWKLWSYAALSVIMTNDLKKYCKTTQRDKVWYEVIIVNLTQLVV